MAAVAKELTAEYQPTTVSNSANPDRKADRFIRPVFAIYRSKRHSTLELGVISPTLSVDIDRTPATCERPPST
jgi:hypothetical protein